MTLHELKCWPPYFGCVARGEKPFEVRKNDRGYQCGDRLLLHEWDPTYNFGSGGKTGVFLYATITYVLPGPGFGVEPGYAVLGLALD